MLVYSTLPLASLLTDISACFLTTVIVERGMVELTLLHFSLQ